MLEEDAATSLEQLAEAESSPEIPGDNNNRANLRATLAKNAINHPAGLRAALENTPESARSALLQAIAVSEAGYQRALKHWD